MIFKVFAGEWTTIFWARIKGSDPFSDSRFSFELFSHFSYRFYNENAEKNETYSPCNDQRYNVYTCFRRFILLLNENVNVVIEKYIEFGNSNYVLNQMNQSLICNHTLNERTFSIKDYYEHSCYICIKGRGTKKLILP